MAADSGGIGAIIKRNPRAFMAAVGLHLALVFFLVVGVDWLKFTKPAGGGPKMEVVQAQVIDEKRIQAESERIQQEEQQKKNKQLEEKKRAEQELATLKKKQEAEKQRLEEIEQQRKAMEIKRKKDEEKRKLEEQTQAEEKKHKEDELKKAEEKKKADEAKKQAEEKKKADAERKRKEQEAVDRKRQEDELRQMMEAEQKGREESNNAQELARIGNAIREKVTRNWLRPSTSGMGLVCKLSVRLSPSGTVLGVQVIQSSGDPSFDESAKAAVYKSDPLPPLPAGIPSINFTFDPDNR